MPQLIVFTLSTGAVNTIYGNIVGSLWLIFVSQYIKEKRIVLGGVKGFSFWLLFAFGFIYVVFGVFSLQGIEFYMITPLLTYMSGWVICRLGDDKEAIIKSVIYAMILGYGLHALLNYIINIGRTRWNLTDFFSGSLRSATGSGVINTYVFSLLIYFVVVEKKNRFKLLGLICFIISVLYGFLLGTRTQFLILIVVSIVSLSFYFFEKNGLRGVFDFLLIVIMAIAVIGWGYSTNFSDIRTMVDSTNLAKRFIDSATQMTSDEYRISSVMRGLLTTFEYPLGGLQETSYYHNMWLDAGRVAGLFPMLLLLMYSAVTSFHASEIFSDKDVSIELRYIILAVCLGVQMNFFVEPVLEGIMDFFLMFCRVNGMIDCLYYTKGQGKTISIEVGARRYENS